MHFLNMDLTYLKKVYGLRLDLIHVMFNLLLIQNPTLNCSHQISYL